MNGVGLPHRYSGKVREVYDVDDEHLLIVASDRISVFDVILGDTIPDKGAVLTRLFRARARLRQQMGLAPEPEP